MGLFDASRSSKEIVPSSAPKHRASVEVIVAFVGGSLGHCAIAGDIPATIIDANKVNIYLITIVDQL